MANRFTSIGVALSAWLGVSLLGGCNAVLGIEEAQPRESGGGTGGGSVGGTVSPGAPYTGSQSCTTLDPKCAACVTASCSQSNQNDVNLCLQDAECRATLDRYAACLGHTCNANAGQCFESLLVIGAKVSVPDCIIKNCATYCARSPVYSPCELYCSCMGADCPSRLTDGTFSGMDDCVTKCNLLQASSPELVTCRRTHCEIAGLYPNELQHCDHAVGLSGLCAAQSLDTAVRTTCTDKSLVSFACSQPSDCCSGSCQGAPNRACAAK